MSNNDNRNPFSEPENKRIILDHYDLDSAKAQAKKLLNLDCDIEDIVTDVVALSPATQNNYKCLCRWNQGGQERTLWLKIGNGK